MRAGRFGGGGAGDELVEGLAAIVADVFINRHKAPKDNNSKSTPASYNEAGQGIL